MHSLSTAIHYPLANLQPLAHLNHLPKDHHNPLFLQDPCLAAPLMPTLDYHLSEDRYPPNGLRNCPWRTMADHLPAVALPTADSLADEAPQQMPSPHSMVGDNICNALTCKGKLNIQKPKSFHSCNPRFNHYTALLWFDLNTLVLSNWQAFAQFDTVAEAKENLFDLQMHNDEWFITLIVHFEKEAYDTGWYYNALQFALCHALSQRIKDILCLAPKQPSYNGYKTLVTQINQQYWEDCREYLAPWMTWNSSKNSN
ncbi:hypothetical protein C0993_011137 [Termitomyces sp. T159_Od127]|nr:hypothetical protein C0993_011137 [Termitomyces sp. T159_Od127]